MWGKGSCNRIECDNHKYVSEGAELSVKVDVQGSPYNHINFALYEPEDGSKVHDASSLLNEENGNTTFSTQEFIFLSTKKDEETAFKINVKTPEHWTAENPTLYKYQLDLVGSDDSGIQSIKHHVGFRQVKLKDGSSLLIGKTSSLEMSTGMITIQGSVELCH